MSKSALFTQTRACKQAGRQLSGGARLATVRWQLPIAACVPVDVVVLDNSMPSPLSRYLRLRCVALREDAMSTRRVGCATCLWRRRRRRRRRWPRASANSIELFALIERVHNIRALVRDRVRRARHDAPTTSATIAARDLPGELERGCEHKYHCARALRNSRWNVRASAMIVELLFALIEWQLFGARCAHAELP